MRIGIREQLAAVVLVTALVPLAVLAIATWSNSHSFVVNVTANSLALTASLKAAQIAADLRLIQSTCSTIISRPVLQDAIKSFYKRDGEIEADTWVAASDDVSRALASGGLSALLQVTVFSRNNTGNPYGILNTTANCTGIKLPYTYPNGTSVMFGDEGLGYPRPLYPTFNYESINMPDPADSSVNKTNVTVFDHYDVDGSTLLLVGPMLVNETYAMLSLTMPIKDNEDADVVLGYMTVVAAATFIVDVLLSREGLANTGIVLLVGPNELENQFKFTNRPATMDYEPNSSNLGPATVKFVFPPMHIGGQADRHSTYNRHLRKYKTANFTESQYPAVAAGYGHRSDAINNASSILTTHNENNDSVSVGYARPQSELADWLLVVEQSHSEAWAPIEQLRNIVLASVFSAIGLVLIFVVPMAHYSVRPIRRLREATQKSVTPPGYTPAASIRSEEVDDPAVQSEGEAADEENALSARSKKGILVRLRNLTTGGGRRPKVERDEEHRRRGFRIPGKVRDRKHLVKDELSDLTATFNEMTDELLLQYTGLESKVLARTQELELSKKAAEAANESKTLFIANISHELKTPLNGILGMCAVCMNEDDLPKIKRSLQVVYKSGDLLLHLLNDLLTFSKNQIGQQVSLEEKEFRLNDIKTQILTIFAKQVEEGHIDFDVKFVGADTDSKSKKPNGKPLPALGPNGIGRLKDMSLWGDQHRILQVIINLVTNSLKFTPEGGTVSVNIRCLGDADASEGNPYSTLSKHSSQRSARRSRKGSGSNNSQISRKLSNPGATPNASKGTALRINPMDPTTLSRIHVRERSPTPPPPHARTLIFQFEVTDTGPGIPAHLQEQVFEPFVQADPGLSKKYGGTGLGLSICSQLASIMGGDIGLDSTEGVGSTFTMQIPLKHVKSRAPSTCSSNNHGGSQPENVTHTNPDETPTRPSFEANPPSLGPKTGAGYKKDNQPRLVGLSQPYFAAGRNSNATTAKDTEGQLAALGSVAKNSGSKIRVLVAEDNLVNQEVVLRMLRLEDITDVVFAKDGQQAYETVKESMEKGQLFSLIFMDVQMPNLSGIESTRLIRQMGYSAPIVALTAFAEESNMKECYESGMDMFLSKPIRRPALKQVLKKFATLQGAEMSPIPEVEAPTTTTPPDQHPPTPVPNGDS